MPKQEVYDLSHSHSGHMTLILPHVTQPTIHQIYEHHPTAQSRSGINQNHMKADPQSSLNAS